MKSLSKRALFTSASAILLGSSLGLSDAHAASAATPFQPDQTGVSCKITTACFTGTNLGYGAGIDSLGEGVLTGHSQATGYTGLRTAVPATALAGPSVEPQKRNVEYTFGTPSGSPYCVGVYLTQTGYLAVGYALYENCTPSSGYTNAGGFASKIKGLDTDTVWAITTTDPFAPGYTYVYLLDERARQWEVWGESTSGSGSQTFSLINSGELLVGYSGNHRGGVSPTQARL